MTTKQSFAARLSLLTVSASAGIFILASLLIGVASLFLIQKTMERSSSASLDMCALEVEKMLTDVESATHSYIWLAKENKDNPDYMYTLTHKMVEYNPTIVGSAVAYEPNYFPKKGLWCSPYSYLNQKTGEIESSQLGAENYHYHEMEWYKVPVETKDNNWCNPYYDEGGGEQLMTTYSIPLWDENEKVFAVMTADVNIGQLSERLRAISPFKGSFTTLVSSDGRYICHPNAEKVMKENILDDARAIGEKEAKAFEQDMKAGKRGGFSFKGPDKEWYSTLYRPLRNGWVVAVVCPYKSIFEELSLLRWLIAGLIILGLIILFYANKRIIERTTQPVTELAYAALNIAQGSFHAQIPKVKSKDELGRLYDSLRYLQKSINSYISELRTTTASNERFESELNIAKDIQMQMLPSAFPSTEIGDIYASLTPAKEVGGDLYDFVLDGNTLYFIVGDVSGKGVPAALYMAITRAAFRAAIKTNDNVAGIVSMINNTFCDGNTTNMFVTMFVGKLNADTMLLEYCNAGHNPIIIKDEGAPARYLKAKPNLAGGLFVDFPYEGESLQLSHPCRLMLYTDGVSEAEDKKKELYGEDRLIECASGVKGNSREAVETIISSVKKHTNGAVQNDDITMMVITLK